MVREHGVSVWNSVPAQLVMFHEYLRAEPAADTGRLRLAMLSGDWIPVTLPDAVRARVPGLRVVSWVGRPRLRSGPSIIRWVRLIPAWAAFRTGGRWPTRPSGCWIR